MNDIGDMYDYDLAYAIKIRQLEHELQQVQENNNGWISVKDRLPETNCLYIVCKTIYPHQIVFEASWEDGKWLSVVTSNQLEYITHWMPLPKPPRKDNNES